ELPGNAVRIGSSPYSDVTFDAEESKHVAPVHAKIVFTQGAHWLYDNQADEVATIVNGEMISKQALKSGDELRFGENGPKLRFEQVGAPPSTAPPAPALRVQATESFDWTLVMQG